MRYFCLILMCLLTACADARAPQNAVPKSVIKEHVRAFNAGDVEAMAKMQHPDIEWLSVSGTTVSVEVSGREALSRNMTTYFSAVKRDTRTLHGWNVNLPYLSVTETVNWTAKDGSKKLQSSLTVYQLEDNLIRRVWYYPAVDN